MTNVELAKKLYRQICYNDNLELVIKTMTGTVYKQHNAYVSDGQVSAISHFKQFKQEHPDLDLTILRSFGQGDYVFCYCVQWIDGRPTWITNDIFKFDRYQKAVEHWDTITPAPTNMVEAAAIFGGETAVTNIELTTTNQAIIKKFTASLHQKDYQTAKNYLAYDFHFHFNSDNHKPIKNWDDYFNNDLPLNYDKPFLIIAEGNFVAVYNQITNPNTNKSVASMQLYRLHSQRIVEAWFNNELILPKSQWINSGKF